MDLGGIGSTSLRGRHERPPRRRARPDQPHRALVLVDIENLHGEPRSALAGELAAIAWSLHRAASIHPLDHVVVGCNPKLALPAKASWPSIRLVIRGGPDGADLALLRCVEDVDFVMRRYDRVVIASGDGIFEEAAARLLRSMAVDIYSRPEALSWRLRRLGVTHPLVVSLPPPSGHPVLGPPGAPGVRAAAVG